MTRPTVETYLRELAELEPTANRRAIALRLAKPKAEGGLGVCYATVYRMINANDAKGHAGAILAALDERRAAKGQPETSKADLRNLTGQEG